MPFKCCVPNCKGNYNPKEQKVSVFKVLNDLELFKKWKRAISRADRELTARDHVCEDHFAPHQILRSWRAFKDGEEIVNVPYKTPRLIKDAVPCFFPNCPSYHSKPDKPPRRSPRKRSLLHAAPNKRQKTDNADNSPEVQSDEM
ncbi:uncharacterized protein [Centruroides vittatus]|uniref:uncharacterized protein n=1 Tax=Centruroides vittatus TaxID=120091 RepID=UPI00350F0915